LGLEYDRASFESLDEIVLFSLTGFRRSGFFQAQPFHVEQADTPADDPVGNQAGLRESDQTSFHFFSAVSV
jgi:hypothetical protein